MNNYKRNSEAWQQQVQKELNGKAMGELEFNIDSNLKIDPLRSYLYDSTEKTEVAPLPQSDNLSYLRIHSEAENSLVLDALKGGADGIYYEFQKTFEIASLDSLLKGVFGQMIFQVFDIEESQFSKEAFESKLQALEFEKEKYFVLDNSNKYTVDFSSGEVLEPIVELLRRILKEGAFPQEPIIVKPTQKFFVNISALRALRVLLMNLEENIVPKILLIKESSNSEGDFNQNLIEFTTDTLSSSIGGADFISLKPFSNHPDQLSSLRNIPNLLHLESELTGHYDGVEGARSLDFMVDKICEEVWSKLNEE
ncbi:hypothetical protein SAMN06298216_0305 [Spirosomataceae bacterium TFI 002]|nr:hypothetical protein SAMN06298216_0305 [Spirosomataceae bacterium TFI 002]